MMKIRELLAIPFCMTFIALVVVAVIVGCIAEFIGGDK
jgi:hypothetical protein